MFLFELVLVLTRPVVSDREGAVQFQVYRQPLPAAHLHLEDIPDGEPGSSGSFRGAFTGNDKGIRKNTENHNKPNHLDNELKR